MAARKAAESGNLTVRAFACRWIDETLFCRSAARVATAFTSVPSVCAQRFGPAFKLCPLLRATCLSIPAPGWPKTRRAMA